MSGFLFNSNNKLQFQGINSLQDLINNYSVDGTGDISDLNLDTLSTGDILENYGEGGDWFIRTEVGGFDQLALGDHSKIEIDGDLQVNYNIITDINEDKEIFIGVTSKTIKIGGNGGIQNGQSIHSKIEIDGDLQVNYNILTDTDENKEIFKGVTNSDILIGGNNSTVRIGKDLFIPNDVVIQGSLTQKGETTFIHSTNIDISDNVILLNKGLTTANPNFASGFLIMRNEEENYIVINDTKVLGTNIIQKESHGLTTDQEIFIEDFNYNTVGQARTFVRKFDNDTFQIKYGNGSVEDELVTKFNFDTDKRIYTGTDVRKNQFMGWDEMEKSFVLGITKYDGDGTDTDAIYLESKSKLLIDNLETDFDTKIGGNITTTSQEDKELWKDIISNKITIGGSSSTVEIGNDLKVYKNILTGVDEDKEIFTGVTSKTIKIGSDNTSNRSKTEIGGDLQVNYNISTNRDEDKEFWTDVITKQIKIGGGSSRVKFDSTDHIVFPVGSTNQRTDVTGGVRFNTDITLFEGYDGSGWNTLGGVIDIDKDTHIKAEDNPNDDNDQLKFTTAGVERMRIDQFGNVGIQSNFSDVNLYLGGTDALRIPNGTDVERPVAADISHLGYIRYNTDKQIFEGLGVNLVWGPLATGASKTSPTGETEIGLEILDDAHLGVFTDTKMRIKLHQTGNLAIGTPVVIDGETIPVAARVIVDISSNDAIRIPSGTTSERPSTANSFYENEYKGYIRWNTDFEEYEGYIGSNKWGSLTKVISQNKRAFIEPIQLPYDTALDFYAGDAGGTSEKMMRITLNGPEIYNTSGEIVYNFNSTKLLTQTELEIDGKITMRGDIISKTDEDLEIFTSVKSNTIKIGGYDEDNRSKLEIGGDVQVNYNILADRDENKDIFVGITSKTIKIGSDENGDRSKTEIGGDLQVNYNILTDTDENKEIFTGVVRNTIKIGSDFYADHSKTEIGGDLQVNYNILANTNENKEIFTGVISNTIKIGSKQNDNNRSVTEIGGDLQVNYNILTKADEDKEIFTGVETKMITIGGSDSDVKIANTLQVRDDITLYGHIIVDDDDNRDIFTGVTTSTIKIGGNKTSSNRSITEIGGDLQVNFDILTDVNKDKEIFMGVTSNTIKIGGDESNARSKIEIGGDLQVNYNILGNNEENISIFTNDDYIISIGNDDSTVILGNDLQVNNHILTGADEDKEIFVGVLTNTIKIGGDDDDNRSKTEIGGDLQVNYNILGNNEDNISIFANDDYIISIGNNDSTIILGNDLQVNNHILTGADEDKEIFVGVLTNTIKIGGDDDEDRSKIEIGGDLQVNYNILTNENEDKEIFTGVTNKKITIGGENSQTDVGELKVYKNIITNENEDKEIFTGVISNTIKIGADGMDSLLNVIRSKTEIGGDLQVNYNILTDIDEDKEIFKGVVDNNITIGGSSSKLIVGNNLEVTGDIFAGGNRDIDVFTDVVNKTIKVGGPTSQVTIVNLQVENITTEFDTDKEIFKGVTNKITIGGEGSVFKAGFNLEVGNDLQINRNIIAGHDEDKEIFTDVITKDITIGGSSSEVVIGGNLRTNKNILASNDEDKEIFTNVLENRIKIGGADSVTFIGGSLRINNSIISDNVENKEIFTDIAENDVIIGSSIGQVVIGNDLKVTSHIESETTSNKNIFTNIGVHSLSLGSLFGTVIANNDLILTGTNLLANADTNKTIFSNIKGAANSSIIIGGVDNDNQTKSRTVINGLLQPNYDIISGNVDTSKNIFTDVNTATITLGGVAGKISINNNLEVKNSIISDQDEDKNIFTDVTKEIVIGGPNSRLVPGGVVVFRDDIVCEADIDLKIFEAAINSTITIGGINSQVILNNDAVIGGNIVSKEDEDKSIYPFIIENDIYIGHSNSNGSIVTNSNLKINKKILSNNSEDKEIFTDLEFGRAITIGGMHSTLSSGGHLQITQDVKAGEDRDINLFNDVISKKIIIGREAGVTKFRSNSHIVLPMGNDIQRINEIGGFRYNTSLKKLEFCHEDDVWQEIGGNKSIDKKTYISTESSLNANDNFFRIFANNAERFKIDGGGNIFLNSQEKIKATGSLEVTGDIFASTNRDMTVFSDITNKTITIGSGSSRVIFNSSDSLVLPVGGSDRNDRTTVEGAIRYNHATKNFEGCDGTAWISLGGLIDEDGDTFIRTEFEGGSDNDYLRFVTAGNERMLINSDGNIGIGVDPQESLHVNGNIMINGSIVSQNNDNVVSVNVNEHNIKIGDEQLNVIFDSNKSIVLPKGNNDEKSDLQGAIRFNTEYDVFEGYDGTKWSSLSIIDADKDTYISAESNFASDEDQLKFVTSGSQRMVIKDDGKIGINKLLPTKELDIVGDVGVSGSIFVNELNINKLGNNDQDFLIVSGDIVPESNNTQIIGGFNRGFAELFLSESIWFGNSHNLLLKNNVLKIKQYNSTIPVYVLNAFKSQPGQEDTGLEEILQIAEATIGIDKDDFAPINWLAFLKTIDPLYSETTLETMIEDNFEVIDKLILAGGGWQAIESEQEIFTEKRIECLNTLTVRLNVVFDRNLQVGGDIFSGSNTSKRIFEDVSSNVISIGSGTSRVHLKSTDSVIIPTGITMERTSLTGALRFNTETTTFEGFNGYIWTQFAQGVQDSDKDTYIQPDNGYDDDALSFFTRNKRHFVIDRAGHFGFGLDNDPSEEFDVNLIAEFQKNVTINKDLIVNDNIYGGSNEDKTIFSDVSSNTITIGSGSSKVIMNSTDHMVVPVGITNQRSDVTGGIRYNSETDNFEGCNGTNWNILSGVSDVDKDTYITAETNPNDDNDELHFYTKGSQRMIISDDGKIGININTPTQLLHVNGIGKIETLQINNLDSNLIPIANETYSLGSEINKFKEVFASENGIWIGDQHKISVQDGDLKLRKRKIEDVPESIINALINSTIYAGTTAEQAKTLISTQILLPSNANTDLISNVTLSQWLDYVKKLDDNYNNYVIEDIFSKTSGDYVEEFDLSSWRAKKIDENTRWIYSDRKIGIGSMFEDTEPSTNLHINGNIQIDSNILTDNDADKEIFTAVNSKTITIGSGSSKVRMDSNDHMVLPIGITNQRTNVIGGVRYNSETNIFEGYDGLAWGSLSSVMDIDKDTYISAESNPTDDNDELQFYTDGVQRMIINATGETTLHNDTTFDGNILANGDVDKEIFTNVNSKTIKLGGGSSRVIMNSTDHMVIPVGNTSERTAQVIGGIRYNTEILNFEGCDGVNWAPLTGLTDIDKDTYITAETNPNDDNDELKFVTNGTQRMIINSDGQIGIGNDFLPSADFDVKGNAIIRGDLTVKGTRTYINTSNLDISDNIIKINSGIGSNENANISSGILIQSHNNNKFFGWDDGENAFILSETDKTGDEEPENINIISKSNLKIKDLDAANITISSDIQSASDKNTNIFSNISTKTITIGSGSSKIKFDSTDSVILPVGGNTELEKTAAEGAIRFNSTLSVFEGCDGVNWATLGGLTDLDKDTYISAETVPGTDNDELKFVTAGTERMIIATTGEIALHTDTTFDGNILANDDVDKEIFTDVTSKTIKLGGGSSTVIMNSTDHMVIPIGDTSERTDVTGAIRYNSEIKSFEGCHESNQWSTLGGLSDIDGDTKITAETSPGTDNDELKFITSGTQRMIMDSNGKIAIGTEVDETEDFGLDVDVDVRFKKKLVISGKIIADVFQGKELSIPNIPESAPSLSFNDLMGPPRKIVVDSSNNTAVDFSVIIEPVIQYHVGFMPQKLPTINKMNIKLINVETNEEVLDTELITGGDVDDPMYIASFEDLTTLKFSKQDEYDDYSNGVYAFYSLDLNYIYNYKLRISFQNYHPHINITEIQNNYVLEPNAPDIIDTITIHIPSGTQGVLSIDDVDEYGNPIYTTGTPSIDIEWDEPVANDGVMELYTIEYESTDKLNGSVSGDDVISRTISADDTYLTQTLGDVLYGTKYRFRIKSQNDADGISDWSQWTISDYYTNVPEKPFINRDNLMTTQALFNPASVDSSVAYTVVSYVIYDGASGNWGNTILSSEFPLFKTTNNFIQLNDILGINCSNKLCDDPNIDTPISICIIN